MTEEEIEQLIKEIGFDYKPEDLFFTLCSKSEYPDLEGKVSIAQPGNYELVAFAKDEEILKYYKGFFKTKEVTEKKIKAIIISDLNDFKKYKVGLSDEEIIENAYKNTKELSLMVTEHEKGMYKIDEKGNPIGDTVIRTVSNPVAFFLPDNSLMREAQLIEKDIIFIAVDNKCAFITFVDPKIDDVKAKIEEAKKTHARNSDYKDTEVVVYDYQANEILSAREYLLEHRK